LSAVPNGRHAVQAIVPRTLTMPVIRLTVGSRRLQKPSFVMKTVGDTSNAGDGFNAN
jgi:hypothetical protein